MEFSYSFDDVLISPKFSNIISRKDINLQTKLTRNITLNFPIISSPMDTVTEDNMAISMALKGGLGIIHRFQTIESQINMVKKVKRFLSYIIEKPYKINENEYITKINEYNVSGILVVNDNDNCVGIVSERDLNVVTLFTEQNDLLKLQIKDIMTPFEKMVKIDEYDYLKIIDLYKKYKVEKIPIIKDNQIKGLVLLKNLLY